MLLIKEEHLMDEAGSSLAIEILSNFPIGIGVVGLGLGGRRDPSMDGREEVVEDLKRIGCGVEFEFLSLVVQLEELAADSRVVKNFNRLFDIAVVGHCHGELEEVLHCINEWLDRNWTAIAKMAELNYVLSDSWEGPE